MHAPMVSRSALVFRALFFALFALSLAVFGQQLTTTTPVSLPGLTLDRLGALMIVLVSGVGAACYHYSIRYMAGEANQGHFLFWLAFTILAAFVLMLATNLVLLFLAWCAVSLGLHELLTFYRHRREVFAPARKKFLISRLGDVALLAAIGVAWVSWGTLDLQPLLTASAESPATTTIALLIALAALTKSAQFPFHSWLPETMEAPTPVSALMHAGIINAGGVLLLRFAPILVQAPIALLLLSVVGTLTLVIGMLAMWTQPSVKQSLAWSTVSQMGFMMVQCGLAAFPAAALHIVGHGFYKAWSFLRSGEVPLAGVTPPMRRPAVLVAAGAAGLVTAVPSIIVASAVTGYMPLHSPGELALSAVLALAVAQLWIGVWKVRSSGNGQLVAQALLAVGGSLAFPLIAFTLYQLMAFVLAPSLAAVPAPSGPLSWIAAGVPVVALAALATVNLALPFLRERSWVRGLYVNALSGWSVGAYADRFVHRIWSTFAMKGA